MTFELEGITIDGLGDENKAKQAAPLLMESAIMAGYNPQKGAVSKEFSADNKKTGSY
ncbi:MAG: hypothetical protein ACI4HI_18520 [Lachnospiraceae bacterium]